MPYISEREVELLVAAWNAHNRMGTAVRVLRDDGNFLKSKTVSEAWLLGGGMPVVKVDGIAGGFSLLRVAVDWADEPEAH